MNTTHAERLVCAPPVHLLATNNPWDGLTYCVCGKETVNSRTVNHTTWHERFIYEHAGRGAQVLGYERYRLDVCLCHEDGTVQEIPCCGAHSDSGGRPCGGCPE